MTHADFFSNFFVVEDPASKKNYRGQIVNEFNEFGKLLRADYKVNHLDIKYLEGSGEPSNLFWNMVTDPFCVSQTLLELIRNANISGWTGISTTVLTKSGSKSIDNYFAITVNGRANSIDYLQTDIIFEQLPGGQFPSFKGLFFDPESWDGSDIFMARPNNNSKSKYTAFIYVTKKFVDTLKKNKVSNIRFINFNDYTTDCEIIKSGATELFKREIEEKVEKASK